MSVCGCRKKEEVLIDIQDIIASVGVDPLDILTLKEMKLPCSLLRKKDYRHYSRKNSQYMFSRT